MKVETWRCSGCGKKWEISGEDPPAQGPFVLAFAVYDFRCPNACRSYSDESPKEFDETTIPEGLSFRPLKYREEGTVEWRDIPEAAA